MNLHFPSNSSVRFMWQEADGALRLGVGAARDLNRHGVFIVADCIPAAGAEIQVMVDLPLRPASDQAVRLMGRGVAVRVEAGAGKPKGFAAEVLFQSDSAGLFESPNAPVIAVSHLPEAAMATPWTALVSTNCPVEAVA